MINVPMNKLKLSLQSVRRLTDPLPARQSQMVTTSMNSESNSLFQEELGVRPHLSDGELTLCCPNPQVLAPKTFWGLNRK